MAFSKSKIIRFNDVKTCAPAPGTYNPKFEEHVPVPVLGGAASPAAAPNDAPSEASVKSAPAFKTPTFARQKKFISTSLRKPATKLFRAFDRQEELKEKIVECLNKDQSIRELEQQVAELSAKLKDIADNNARLLRERTDLEEKLASLQADHEEEMARVKLELAAELDNAACKSEQLSAAVKTLEAELNARNGAEMQQIQAALSEMQGLHQAKLDQVDEELKGLDVQLKSSQKDSDSVRLELLTKCEELHKIERLYEDSLREQGALQRAHSLAVEDAQRQKQAEIDDLEFELLRLVSEYQRAVLQAEQQRAKDRQQAEADMARLQAAADRQLQQKEAELRLACENAGEMVRLAEIQSDERLQAVEAGWQLRLDRQLEQAEATLQECQAIAEFNVIQAELEKKDVEAALSTAEDRIRQEVAAANDLQASLAESSSQVQQLLQERRAYTASLNRALETVEMLKKRLHRSDSDVDQLKQELESIERAKLALEDRLNTLAEAGGRAALEALRREHQQALEAVIADVGQLEAQIMQRIDDITQSAASQVEQHRRQAEEARSMSLALRQQLDNQSALFAEIDARLQEAADQNCLLQQANADLETELSCAQRQAEELRADVQELQGIRRKYIEQSGRFDELQNAFEALEADRSGLEVLLDAYQDEAGIRQAGQASHLNHKQKIKYLINLQEQRSELVKTNKHLEAVIKEQKKLIEKQHQELSKPPTPRSSSRRLTREEKENRSSPKRSVSLKMRQESPLKDRNSVELSS